MPAKRNIIVFGESGCGKSSIINMLSGRNVARISSGVDGCTFESSPFNVDILGQRMTLWDTVGFDEGINGSVPDIDAIVKLYKLIRSLSDGVSLLVFVMRAPRIKGSVPRNWKLFREIICQEKVPIVIVITGLELEVNRDQWWWDNQETFQKYEIFPAGHACITATRGVDQGAGYVFERQYGQSRDTVKVLIRSTVLCSSWQVPATEWFKNTLIAALLRKVFGLHIAGGALKKLVSACGMKKEVAEELAKKMKNL